MTTEFVLVTSTTGDEEEARRLATELITARLAACAQVAGPITSVYRWDGDVQTSSEWRLEIKTTRKQVAPLIEYFHRNHSYDVPEIVVTTIEGGAEYLSWIAEETG
jgi:periplasmic divalent cation tolerance protein